MPPHAIVFVSLNLSNSFALLLFLAHLHNLLPALRHELLVEEADLRAQLGDLRDEIHVVEHDFLVVLFVSCLAGLKFLCKCGH